MAKSDARSWWIVVGTFACIHPVTFLVLENLFLADFQGRTLGWVLGLIFTAPLFAVLTSILIMPVTLLVAVLSVRWSRKTKTSRRWILRSALLSAVVVSCSYIPLYLILHMSMDAGKVWLVTIPNAAVAGALSAWVCQRWRPLPAAQTVEAPGEDEVQPPFDAATEAVELPQANLDRPVPLADKQGSMLGVVLVFTILGPLIGWLVCSISILAICAMIKMNLGLALAASVSLLIVFVPLGSVSGLITGFISGLVSRGTLSTARWCTYSTALGGSFSALSIQTVLLVFMESSGRGILGSIAFSLGIMFVIGALSALACAWICRGFRPRDLSLPLEPSASTASPQ